MKQIISLLTFFSFLSFSTSGQTTPSCTPATTAMCTGIPEMSFYINTVSLNGSATVSSSPVCNGYSANTTAFSSSNLIAGQSYNITVNRTPSPFAMPFKIAIWLDVNDDGDFEDIGEELFQGGGTSNTAYSGDITIPAGTSAGLKYLRVMILNNSSTTLTPCGTFSPAETEDYVIQIAGGGCTPTISSNSPVCSGSQLTLSGSLASTYSWYGPNGFTSSDQNINIPATSVTHAGIYTLTTTDGNGCTGSATTNVIIKNSPNLTAGSNSPISEGATLNLTVSDSNPSQGTSGAFDAALNQYVDVVQALPTDNFTIEMWIKTTQTDGGLFETGAGPNNSPEGDKFIYIEGGILKARVVPEGISGLSSGVTVNDNVWHHIAVTQKTTGNEGTKLYVDGVFRAEYQNSTDGYPATKFQIGTECNLAWQAGFSTYRTFYTGLIDNVKVWNVAKTASQIAQGMSEDSPTNTPNLVYYQKFENNVNASVGANGTTPNGITYPNTSFTTFAWTGPSGFSSDLQNPTISPASSAAIGTYTVTATNANGCSSTATTNVAFTTTHLGDAHWTRTFGSAGTRNSSLATATDAIGNVYLTGYFDGYITFGATTLISEGNEDIYIVKYNSSGVVQWAKRAGGAENDGGTGITVIGNSVYVTGYIYGTANFNNPSTTGSNELISAGYRDAFIAKYDDNGNFQWAKRAGGINNDEAKGVAVNGTSIYITGVFNNNANFNTPSQTGTNEISSFTSNDNDIFIAKYSDAGTLQWVKRAGGQYNDIVSGVAVSGTEIYITGSFSGTSNFNTPSATSTNTISSSSGSEDIFIAKYNDSGTFQWAKRAGGVSSDRSNGIAVNGTSVYITGYFQSVANFNTPSANGSNELITSAAKDIFVAKYNDTGTFQWAKRGGSYNYYDDEGYGIAVNGSSVYITGYFNDEANFNTPSATGSNVLESSWDKDIFIAKYNDTGTFQWAKRAGGQDSDIGNSIAVNGTSVYIAGDFQNKVNFNTPSSGGSNELGAFGVAKGIFVAQYNDTGTFQWAKSAGDVSGINIGKATTTDAAGNIYITGEFSGKLSIESNTIYSAGGNDIFIAKYNNRGIIQWIKRAGGVGDDRGFGIAVSGTSVYITGYFEQTANFNTPNTIGSNEITSAGSTDIFLTKFNDTGTFQWARRAGGTGGVKNPYYGYYPAGGKFFFSNGGPGNDFGDNELGRGIAVNGNDVYITGSFIGTANFNTPSASGSNEITSTLYDGSQDYYSSDIFIAKYNDVGTLQWVKREGGTENDNANGIAVNGTSIYITGNVGGSIYVAKYSDTGTLNWSKNDGGGGSDFGLQIAANGSSVYIVGVFGYINEQTFFGYNWTGNIYFGTPHTPENTLIPSVNEYSNIFLAKYSDAGTFQWAKRAGSTNGDVGTGIAVAGSSIYITGTIAGRANFNTPSATGSNEIGVYGKIDAFIAKYNDSGVFQWAKNAGNNNNYGGQLDGSYGIAVNNNVCYIVGSYIFSSNFSYGGLPNPATSTGGLDVFLSAVFDGSLTTSTISGSPFCQGSTIPVNYTSEGTFGGSNVFTAQLLKAGEVVSTATGTSPIALPIPANAAIGSDYRVNVVASNPIFEGTDNGTNLSIIAGSAGGAIIGGSTVTSGINKITLSLSGHTGNVLKWQSSSTPDFNSPIDIVNTTNSLNINNLTATTYYRAVVQNSSCPAAYSAVSSIEVTAPLLSNESITISPKGIYTKQPIDLAVDTTNISYGYDAFISNTKAKENIAIGKNSLKNQAFTNDNTLYSTGNIAIGYESLTTSNPTLSSNGIKNVGIGSYTLQKNTIGKENVGIGYGVLNLNTTGIYNTSIGANSLGGQTLANSNTSFGFQSMRLNTEGSSNSAFGVDALSSNLMGSRNVAFGNEALFNTAGNENTAVGYKSGFNTQGNRNILIGNQAGQNSNASDLLVIENSDSLNALIVGNFATDKIGVNRSKEDLNLRAETFQVTGDAFKELGTGNWVIPSDRRLKTNISYLNSQMILQKVMRLKGATYQWKDTSRGTTPMYGFIAQELKQVFPENIKTDKNGYLSATYGNMDAAFVESIKALEKRNQTLENTNEELRKRISKLKQQLISIEGLLNKNINQKTIQTDK